LKVKRRSCCRRDLLIAQAPPLRDALAVRRRCRLEHHALVVEALPKAAIGVLGDPQHAQSQLGQRLVRINRRKGGRGRAIPAPFRLVPTPGGGVEFCRFRILAR
jgi:hypothetical protein